MRLLRCSAHTTRLAPRNDAAVFTLFSKSQHHHIMRRYGLLECFLRCTNILVCPKVTQFVASFAEVDIGIGCFILYDVPRPIETNGLRTI